MCGENLYVHGFLALTDGSPPRVRGKHGKVIQGERDKRITPACAGKTIACVYIVTSGTDHPRVCGENPAKYLTAAQTAGSPPRVRGKLCFLICV